MSAEILLPTLHSGQIDIYRNRSRFNAIRCGRRWGKTKLIITLAADRVAKGRKVGIFTPEYKQLLEPFDELQGILHPIQGRVNKSDGMMRPVSGGMLDFWYLNDNALAGRGREYDDILVDEAAFTKTPQTLDTWRKSIRPTLLTTRGSAWVFSTPNGADEQNFFWQCCNNPDFGFKEFHAPTNTNPYVPPEEFEKDRATTHPLVFKQEYLAEFVDWSGVAFFGLDKLLQPNGEPYPYPARCDAVYAVVDSATKTGKEHDGTAVSYWAYTRTPSPSLVCLDWDIVQIEGSLLETWLPTVFQNLEALSAQCRARMGSIGVHIEDQNSGSILIQQALRRGWNAHAIESKLTSLGKDERAISVSGYVYRGLVHMSAHAYNKTTTFKQQTKNHMLSQVLGFRIGDKDAAKRSDDLLDSAVYGIAIGLGNAEGY